MSRPRLLLATLVLCAGLLPTVSASANGSSFVLGWSGLQAGLAMRAAAPTLYAADDPMRLRAVSGRAIARGFGGVRFWASGAGYAVGRRSAGYGVQGGASLALDEGVDLTASYRLLGFARGDRLDPELADVAERTGAPFVGLDFSF